MKHLSLIVLAWLLAAGAADAQPALVIAERATVRAEPSATGAVVATVIRGTALEVLSSEGSWLRVRVGADGPTGFVHASFVEQRSNASPPAPGTPLETSAVAPPPIRLMPVADAGAAAQRPPRTFLARVFGGLWNRGGTGVQLGGGIALTPFANPALEFTADASYVRVGRAGGYGGSGNAVFNIVLPAQRVTPFAGAGVTVLHSPSESVLVPGLGEIRAGGGTNAALQILGGVDVPLSDRRAFRGEIRIQLLPDGAAVAALAGLSF
jgi:hypothetical protein